MGSFAGSPRLKRQGSRCYWLMIVLAILALATNVATHTSVLSLPHQGITADSQLSNSARQHLDSDAPEWVPPVAAVAIFEPVSFYPRIAPAGPPIPSLFFEDSLYNRPPPAC